MMPKFRAWDKEENEWIVGFKLGLDDENEFWYLGADYSDAIYSVDKLGKTWELMQSTGLKDKNGVEIFEGDIVAIKYSESGYHYYEKIVFENGTFAAGDEDWLYNIKDYCVVCGNIHENPELLS